jgi:LysM repeat protein
VRYDDGDNHIYYSHYSYDAGGTLVSAQVNDGRPRKVTYLNDVSGQVLRRDEKDLIEPTTTEPNKGGDPHEIWFRFGGKQMGYVGNNGTLATGYQDSIDSRTAPTSTTAFRGGTNFGNAAVDFDLSVDPITSYNQGSGYGSYTVRGGETLSSIAANLWGDASLWYKLAEANGLSATASLAAGQTLTVPSGVMKSTHNASTFKPYDPSATMGDTSPTTPKPQKANKCGIVGAIMLAAVAIAVSAVIAPWATGLITAQLGGLGLGAGATATLGAVAGGAVAGAAGSVASQAVGLATGLQQGGFSWKGVAMAAISGGMGAGVGKLLPMPQLGGSSFLADAARGVAGNVASQGISIRLGLQKRFDWAGVAVAGAVSGAVGWMNSRLADAGIGALAGTGAAGQVTFGNAANQIVSGAAGALAGAAVRTIATGTSFGDNVLAALPQVIGATIGQALSNHVLGAPPAMGGPLEPIDEAYAQPDIVVVAPSFWERVRATMGNLVSSVIDMPGRIAHSINGWWGGNDRQPAVTIRPATGGRPPYVGGVARANSSVGNFISRQLSNPNSATASGLRTIFPAATLVVVAANNPTQASEFSMGVLLGDLAPGNSGATQAGQVVGGFVPVADARDIGAAAWGAVRGQSGSLPNLGIAIIGAVPVVGDAAKSILRNADEVTSAVGGARRAEIGPDVTRMDPRNIRFTQYSVSTRFSGPYTIDGTANALRAGTINADQVGSPMRLVLHEGQYWSLDNRRLAAFNTAGIDDVPVRITSLDSPAVMREFRQKFNPVAGEGRYAVIVDGLRERQHAEAVLRQHGLLRR